jgi:uncharacterized phage-associated protein
MTATPHDLAAEIIDSLQLDRTANAGSDKLHKLLYYAQGHHLAITGRPLFDADLHAGENGPIVDGFDRVDWTTDPRPRDTLTEAALNTVGYVLSRYGRLSILDLQHLSMAEPPWRNAAAGYGRLIDVQDMAAYFKGDGAPFDGFEAAPIDRQVLDRHLQAIADRVRRSGT